MSEIKKNIETCRGEDVLAEVSAAPQDPHFGSLVNEAFDPLKQQALHQAGYDGYSEVIAQHKPYTFASAIIQMKSNLLLLFRALWQFPFGSGTLRSLSDMWQHYITRLQGNETYGIPSRLSSLTDLPSAPLLVADRKISGVPDAADGIPLVRLLYDPSGITELTDDTEFVMTRSLSVKTAFPNVTKVTLGCTQTIQSGYSTWGGTLLGSDCEYHLPKLKKITPQATGVGFNQQLIFVTQTHDIYLPELEEIEAGSRFGLIGGINSDVTDTPYMIYAPILRKVGSGSCLFQQYNACKTGVWKVVLGTIETAFVSHSNSEMHTPNLIHFEFGEGTCANLNLGYWNPSNALDASIDTLVTDEDCHNNLEQFLKNFRTYIALRLATFASNGPTLTLSQAVYDAIKDESHLFVFDEGTMTIYAYLTNIKHWTVTK